MDEPTLKTLLERLRREMNQSGELDPESRDLLRSLDGEIHALLDRSQTGKQEELPLMDSLEASIRHFEVSHPTLSTVLSEIMAVLSSAGI